MPHAHATLNTRHQGGATRYHFTPITEAEARAVLGWEYPAIGTLYQPDPSTFERDLEALLAPVYNYYAVRDEAGELAGFCCYGLDAQVPGGDYSLPAVDIGLGMHPARIGQGRSHGFLAAILAWGRELFAPDFFRATVADINVRSQGLFARAGFLIVQRFRAGEEEEHDFLVMLRAEQTEAEAG